MKTFWINVGPDPVTAVLIRRGNLDRVTQEHCVMTNTEIRMMHLKAKECQELLATRGAGRLTWNTYSFEKNQSVQHLDFQLLASKPVRLLKPLVTAICSSYPRDREQRSVLDRKMKGCCWTSGTSILSPYCSHLILYCLHTYHSPHLDQRFKLQLWCPNGCP